MTTATGTTILGACRLQTNAAGASGLNLSWTYDRHGNRYTQTASGSGSAPQRSVNYDVATNHVSGYAYDVAGNLINDGVHRYAYDAEGNLFCVDDCNTAQDSYDALNRRVAHAAQNHGHFQRYEYNLDGRITDVWQDEGIYESVARYYAGGESVAYWTSDGQNPNAGKMHYQHGDYLGTVHARTNDVGAVEANYTTLPFGDGYSSSGTDVNSEHSPASTAMRNPILITLNIERICRGLDAGCSPIFMTGVTRHQTRKA